MPILSFPALISLNSSSFWCSGKIIEALSEIVKFFGDIDIFLSNSPLISDIKALKSKTTPLPIMDFLSDRKIPEGNKFNL